MCTATLSMSRHISKLNYLRSADTCLTRTRTVIYWLSALARFNKKSLARTHTINCDRQFVQMSVLSSGDQRAIFHVIESDDPLDCGKSTPPLVTFVLRDHVVIKVTYSVFRPAMSKKIMILSLDQRVEVLRWWGEPASGGAALVGRTSEWRCCAGGANQRVEVLRWWGEPASGGAALVGRTSEWRCCAGGVNQRVEVLRWWGEPASGGAVLVGRTSEWRCCASGANQRVEVLRWWGEPASGSAALVGRTSEWRCCAGGANTS